MQSSQEKSNTKRQRENYESSVEPAQFLKIDDLNDFCLMNILGRLKLKHLLNVADTNKRLRSLALDVYQRKFGAMPVSIYASEPQYSYYWDEKVRIRYRQIKIYGLKECLQYLRCFGAFINDLSIYYNDPENTKRYEYVHEYVNDFCAETLVAITFQYFRDIAIEQFQKVFVNIRDVSFVDCDLGEKWPSFVQWFTNLHSLSFYDVSMTYRSIEKPFRNLENLQMAGLYCDATTEFAADLLNGINQLKSLEIENTEGEMSSLSLTELLDLVKSNPSISKLCASVVYDRASSTDVQRLISEHPALVELGLENCTFMPDNAIALIRQLDSLKQFEFHTQVNYSSNERSDFASRLGDCGWDLSIGDTGCCLRTLIYDMYVTLTRRA